MRILALETSTDLGSCALYEDGRVLEYLCPLGRPHSEMLLPLVCELLADAGCALPQVDVIAFGAGPGSFTGLRVACGVAQGLAVAADIPVVPVVTLEAVALASGAANCLAVLDARMGEVYWARLARQGEGYVIDGGVAVGPPATVSLAIDDGVVAGNALAVYPELMAAAAGLGLPTLPEILPRAACVARLAAPRAGAGAGIDAALAAPLYVRDKVARTIAERLADGGRA